MASFDYFKVLQINAQIDVDDIGNCAIVANDDLTHTYYLIIRTELGWTTTIEFGPILPDFDELPDSVICSYKHYEFSESKIKKAIDKFLNDPYRNITQASMIDIAEAKQQVRNLANYI